MTTITSRRPLQISLKADLYEQVREHCNQLDMPMAIWARELIKRELKAAPATTGDAEPAP
jgi:hypothetical protein